jgi:hypothetical protein
VRKLSEILQTTAQSKIFRDFFASEGSESSKKRTKQIRLKTRRSFHTASVELTRSEVAQGTVGYGAKPSAQSRIRRKADIRPGRNGANDPTATQNVRARRLICGKRKG